METLKRAHKKGEPIPLKSCTLCNLISNTMEPLQSNESLKSASEREQESKREDTGARNGQKAEENVPSQVDKKAVSEDSKSEENQDTGDDSSSAFVRNNRFRN